ncbi:hypothetical protein MAL08_07640 [Leptospira noguchii]|nr:hypothetical protein [Leptospira noguchii]UOG39484.1 hypothetical protein MAL08_07640 [Leptospira noguchii]
MFVGKVMLSYGSLEVNSASRLYGRSTGREPVHYEICELRRRPGNSVNAYLWVGVQGVVAPEFIIRPNFLTSNSRYYSDT